MEELAKQNNELIIDGPISRESIVDFEALLKQQEGAVIGDCTSLMPLTHKFAEGMYIREIFIPEGTLLSGDIHKHEHPNVLLSGEVQVATEDGPLTLVGPLSMISKAGTKRLVYAKTDVVWITYHLNPTNTQDLDELRKEIIADSYEDYDKFIAESKKQTQLN